MADQRNNEKKIISCFVSTLFNICIKNKTFFALHKRLYFYNLLIDFSVPIFNTFQCTNSIGQINNRALGIRTHGTYRWLRYGSSTNLCMALIIDNLLSSIIAMFGTNFVGKPSTYLAFQFELIPNQSRTSLAERDEGPYRPKLHLWNSKNPKNKVREWQ